MQIYAQKVLFLQKWNTITVNSVNTSKGVSGGGPHP